MYMCIYSIQYTQFSWCLLHQKKDNYFLYNVYERYMTWTHPPNSAFHAIHTSSVTPNASKWRYILSIPVFSSSVEFLLGMCHILTLMTTIVLNECMSTAEYVFLFLSVLLLWDILFDSDDHFSKDTRTWWKPAFQRWHQAPVSTSTMFDYQKVTSMIQWMLRWK